MEEQDNEEVEENEKPARNLIAEKQDMYEELDSRKEQDYLKKIEAAMFIAGRWLNMQQLVMLTDLNPILIKQMISKLREKYNQNSAIEILNKDNEWKMDVKAEHVNMINKLATGSAEFTSAEQETLAVIAYKQPVKQSVIIKIRGNKAYEHVKNFISLGLVRGKKLGHTLELGLSDDFYDYFHVGDGSIPNTDRESEDSRHVSNSQENSDHDRKSESIQDFRHLQGKEGEQVNNPMENGTTD